MALAQQNVRRAWDNASLWRLVAKNGTCILAIREGGDGIPFYGVHSIAGDLSGIGELAPLLGPNQPLYGIQVPKRRMNAACVVSIEALARHHVQVLLARQPEGPVILAGWSAGAIIALEMAQQLRALGRDVPLLIAFDGAPCNTGAGLRAWHPLYAIRLALNLPAWIRSDVTQDWSLRGIARRFTSKLDYRFGISLPRVESKQTLDGETVRRLLRSRQWQPGHGSFIHAMYTALATYRPMPYAGRVIAFETSVQPLYHLRQIGAAWRKLARQVEVVPVSGNHSSLFREPALSAVGSHLRCRLEELRHTVRAGVPPCP